MCIRDRCIATAAPTQFALSLTAITLATGFMWAAYTVFWAIPSQYLQGEAAAGGIALINSIGLLGGFLSPSIIGWIKETNGSLSGGLYAISALLVAGALPVSYTHLDVYKRQQLLGLGDLAVVVGDLLRHGDEQRHGRHPVSYTHLDVYKRQRYLEGSSEVECGPAR